MTHFKILRFVDLHPFIIL